MAPATRRVVRVSSASPRLATLPKLRLVARLHVDLLRVASAGCRSFR
jgi:hypothetical protein